MRLRLLTGCLAALALPAGVHAQNCTLDSNPTSKMVRLNSGTPSEQVFIGGGASFTCPDGKLIKADSAIVVPGNDQTYLIGHASYSDREKTVVADRLYNWGRDKHLQAQSGATLGTVTLTDKINGAVIRSETMDYFQARPGQPESLAIMYGGSPHAVLLPHARQPSPADSAGRVDAAPTSADTVVTVVDAQRMEMKGQKTFHAIGGVVITRSDMHGTSTEAFYTPNDGHLTMSGAARVTRVTGDSLLLTGGTIDGTVAGNAFKDVTATFKAQLDTKDLHVTAPSLTVSFADGQVQRLVALSAARAKRVATDGDVLAHAIARDFTLWADSIDARAPAQKLDHVVAVGHAYGVRQNDSIKVELPPIASSDWLRGDTITGFFTDAAAKPVAQANGRANGRNGRNNGAQPARAAPAARDSTERVLERIVAVGAEDAPASSMYRITDAKKPDGSPAISYLLARRITVAFRDGQVSVVNAEGDVRGMHLEPPAAKPAGKQPAQKAAGQVPAPRKNVAATPAGGARP